MGFRSLLELDHDSIVFDEPDKLIEHLRRYANSGDRNSALPAFGLRPIAMRHSSEPYYISERQWGFPARLPYEEQQNRVRTALQRARKIVSEGPALNTKVGLVEMIALLVDVIEEERSEED